MQQVNFITVLVAALSSFLSGGLWYSKVLFGPGWQREAADTRPPGLDGGYHSAQFALHGLILGLWR